MSKHIKQISEKEDCIIVYMIDDKNNISSSILQIKDDDIDDIIAKICKFAKKYSSTYSFDEALGNKEFNVTLDDTMLMIYNGNFNTNIDFASYEDKIVEDFSYYFS